MNIQFTEFPKIPRLFRNCLITEKIDGTNATICITENFKGWEAPNGAIHTWKDERSRSWAMFAGSRTRWITPEADNHGFAKWVKEHAEELMTLGEGMHRGEWWGSGIQRGYGLPKGEKRLSLFNTSRWCLHGQEPKIIPQADPRIVKTQEILPACVGLVPVLYEGMFDTAFVNSTLTLLGANGSIAAPGFMKSEGIVVFHVAANSGFKVTLEKDSEPKGRK
jgi:hypothetical protein